MIINISVVKRCNVTNPCKNGGQCLDTDSGEPYKCNCQPGYTGDVCDKGGFLVLYCACAVVCARA